MPVGADQVNVVPYGIIPLVPSVGVTPNKIPLQVMILIGVTVATGFSVTVTVKVDPVQVPETGVTI